MLYLNPRALRAPYPAALKSVMNISAAKQSRDWLMSWSDIAPEPTPLISLPGLAAELGVAHISLKDEAQRSDLGSFKALGAPIALVRQIIKRWPELDLQARNLFGGQHHDLLKDFTVISATDGNHGRALAAAAQSVGCRCVIVLHAQVSLERERAIAAFDAHVVRISGNYDQSVEEAARLARCNDWLVVSDTSYAGYEEIPRDVMQGYGTLAAELLEQSASQTSRPAFSHVFLQGGVGGLAAGVASYLWEFHGAERPYLVVVEPQQADCLFQSAKLGHPANASGSVDSVMAGLACGATSPLAWRFLQPSVDCFVTVPDAGAVVAMQQLAAATGADQPIIAGESGAAGLAGLNLICKDVGLSKAVGLDAHSRILLINTEGATAPAVYQQLVGESAQSVTQRQRHWRQQAAG